MRRRLLPFAVILLLLVPAATLARFVFAEDPPAAGPQGGEPAADEKAEAPIPPLAADDEAKEALKAHKKDDKAARRYKGDERTAMREVAMRKLARTQHPLVADAFFKLTKDRNADVRTLAVMYLGEQRAIPGYAGSLVIKALQKNDSDAILAMFAIEAVEKLNYRGAVDVMRALMAHKDEGVKKVAILYIGDAAEWRMLEDLLKIMKDLKIDTGWKTEGHEVRYDSGAAGDADQKQAEKIYKDRYGNSARKARSGGRAMRDMKPVLLEAMKKLTGEDFFAGQNAREWAEAEKDMIERKQKALDEEAAMQAAEAAALVD